MNKKNHSKAAILLLILFFFGCTTPPMLMDHKSLADNIAAKAGFKKEYIRAGDFNLLTYQQLANSGDTIRIYIEGDGNAWETKHKLSDNPTPRQPTALYLACVDNFPNIAYIARPGQYSSSGLPDCDSKYWSEARFAPEVIDSFDKAIDQLKEKSGAKHIELVGYSGGAAIAVLVTARRSDITAIRTVAGNLNTAALCDYHHVSPLTESLNPIDYASGIKHIPQRHFTGSKDKIVPSFIAQSFVQREGDKNYDRITTVNATHTKGWQEDWKKLLSISPL